MAIWFGLCAATFAQGGPMANLQELRPDWSRVDKVFASHLHSDHDGGIAELNIGGWMNDRSLVFGGDSYPNKWFIRYAKGAELAAHECLFTPVSLGTLLDTPPAQAIFITSCIHTPPPALGKIMSEIKPRHAIGYHFWT